MLLFPQKKFLLLFWASGLPGLIITAPPSVCVPEVIGAKCVDLKPKKKNVFSQ